MLWVRIPADPVLQQLITNPMMLLCDEPTSGLDSFMAQNVMAAMKKMAEEGRTVISTIHQPSSEVFAMFDRLLILAEGRVAFLGDVQDALAFFERLGMCVYIFVIALGHPETYRYL